MVLIGCSEQHMQQMKVFELTSEQSNSLMSTDSSLGVILAGAIAPASIAEGIRQWITKTACPRPAKWPKLETYQV